MSLRARILLLILASTLMPVLAVLWVLLDSRSDTIALAQEQLTKQAEGIASDLDDRISGTAQLQFGLARVPLLASADKKACSAFLADVLKEHPQYTGLLTILPNGKLHCDSLQTGRELDVNDRDYFKRAKVSTRYVVETVIGRLSGKGVLQIAHPVRAQDGALQYVLLASLKLDEFGRAAANALPYENMNLQISNADGSIVMDFPGPGATPLTPRPEERAFVLDGTGSRTATLGQDRRIWTSTSLKRTQDAGLHLALSVPQVDLIAREDAKFRRVLGLLLLFSVVLLLVGLLLGEFALRRQAARLMDGISRLDRGVFSEPIGAPYPKGEIGGVMAALDRMGKSLRQQGDAIRISTELLKQQASTDALTGLANRNLLNDRLTQALVYSHRAQRTAGVLLLDLDRFKNVNDSLGHSQGDVLLKEVARRLLGCVREGDTVARLGGDEFVIVLSDMAHVSDMLPIAQAVLAALAEPVSLNGRVVNIAASLGISVYPRDGDSAETLIRHADTAMYRAKAQGGNSLEFFRSEMNQAMQLRLQTETGLRRALEQHELRLFFQPIVDLRTGCITAAEALLRWQHPERGIVSPGQFIDIAEETALIIPLGRWVLQEACRQARAWQIAGLGSLPVAVNLSARQFNSPTLLDDIAGALAATQCPVELLQLEITESMVITNADLALQTMHRIKAMGVQLSIDDFGTGYSSLSYLKRFPVSKLKIDQTFIADIHTDANGMVIVDAILTLARKLGLRTVAEGVENTEQLQQIASLDCDEYQGYLFSKPLPNGEFMELLRQSL